MTGGDVQWRSIGEGLRLETARDVARIHGVPLGVVLNLEAVDGAALAAVEDHVIVHKDAGSDMMKMANYEAFRRACEEARGAEPQQHQVRRLTVVIMPYADLDSCVALDLLTETEPQFAGYASIEVANGGGTGTLLWKKRGMAVTLQGEASNCRHAKHHIEALCTALFPANNRRLTHTLEKDREIAMERLVKAHLDANEYGYAHDVMLLLLDGKRRKKKNDDVFLSPGCYDPCHAGAGVPSSVAQRQATVDRLEAYKTELSRKFGTAQLDSYPERSVLLKMAAQSEFKTELVLDVLETAAEDIERIAQQLEYVMNQPSLLGCSI